MAAVFVQATNFGSNVTATTIPTAAFGSNTTAGNSLICAMQWDQGGAPRIITSMTDSKSNSGWAVIGSLFTDANNNAIQHAYCLNIASAGASHTVTCNLDGLAGFRRIVCFEVSGLATSGAFDQDSGGNDQTGTNVSATSVSPGTDGQFIFASCGVNGGTASNTLSAGAGMIEPANATASPASTELMCEYQVQTTATAIAAPFVRSASGACGLRASTFKVPAASFTWLEMFGTSLLIPRKHHTKEVVGY